MRTPLQLVALLCALAWLPCAAEELLVFAAVSTTEPLDELGREFEALTGTPVRFAFAGSGALARQIVHGAPADLFLAADERSMDLVAKAGKLVPSSRRNLLSNRLVVIAPLDSRFRMAQARDLLAARQLALADPEAQGAGRYARAWLETAGLWEALAPKVRPAVDVRAALASVEARGTDAAVVYQTDAPVTRKVRVVYRVPLQQTPAIRYPIALLTHGKGTQAEELLQLLEGERGRAAFARAGFFWVAGP